jgi:hypothetical protein
MIDPREFTCTETLKNGLAVTIRAMRPDDRDGVAAAVRKLDPESVYSRLFSYRKELTGAGVSRIMTVDPIRDGLDDCRRSLPDDRRVLCERYRLEDSTGNVVGIGSVG